MRRRPMVMPTSKRPGGSIGKTIPLIDGKLGLSRWSRTFLLLRVSIGHASVAQRGGDGCWPTADFCLRAAAWRI